MRETQSKPFTAPLLQARLRGRAGSLMLDLNVELRCSWTVLFGPSGAGKSTVLRALCGLTRLQQQQVVLNDANLTLTAPHQRKIGSVSQQTALFPHMTAMDNVLFAISMRNEVPRSERLAEARLLLERFHAGDAARKYPHMLSGGEKQRVALARAIGSRPRLLLLDEAFSGLQTQMRSDLVSEVKRWQGDSGVPVISVTHDAVEALSCADEVLRMAGGRIVAQGPSAAVLAEERDLLLRQLTSQQ